MSRHARPTKQFDLIGKNFGKLGRTQRALVRRTDYRGVYFDDGLGAQSKEEAAAMQSGEDLSNVRGIVTEIKEVIVDWSEAAGVELDGPTYLTLNQKGQDILRFKVTADHHFEFYSNTRNFIDVSGKIEKE